MARTRNMQTRVSTSATSGRRGFAIPNPVSTAREMMAIVREMSFDELRDAAMRYPRLAVVAPTLDDAQMAAERFFGEEARQHVATVADAGDWPEQAQTVLVDRASRFARRIGDPRVVGYDPSDNRERVLKALFATGNDVELGIGRMFPATRAHAATHVINSTALANGQFALVSNIPALVPVVGGILAAGADTIVLTKNQLMLIFKLAAIHGRDLDNRWRIYAELAPVVGAAMFWRTVARELAAMLPFAAGTVPKVAIAFAGTYAAGMAAHLFYLEGRKASPARMRAYYRDALLQLRDKPLSLPRQLPDRVRALDPRRRDDDTPPT